MPVVVITSLIHVLCVQTCDIHKILHIHALLYKCKGENSWATNATERATFKACMSGSEAFPGGSKGTWVHW